jgi:hypothetical protein
LIITSTNTLQAQELNAQVQINSQSIQKTNKQVFTTLETAIREFLNNRKWTDETYSNEERIRCSFLINIRENPSIDEFIGSIQIQYSRPVYMSGYDSPIFVHQDNQFSFRYLEFDRLDFAENQNLSNLTSVLAYYAYIIIGLDHDSFELEGGTPYFQKAQNIVGIAQNSNYTGWNSFAGPKSRYQLIDDLLSTAFSNYRKCLYEYHRLGLDKMYDNAEQEAAKKKIMNALLLLKSVNDKRPSSTIIQIFFDAKSQEIISIFNGGSPMDIRALKDLLPSLDATNASKYEQMGAR